MESEKRGNLESKLGANFYRKKKVGKEHTCLYSRSVDRPPSNAAGR